MDEIEFFESGQGAGNLKGDFERFRQIQRPVPLHFHFQRFPVDELARVKTRAVVLR